MTVTLQIIITVLGSIFSALGVLVVVIFKGMRTDLREIRQSVDTLNKQLATVISDLRWQKEKIDRLESRLDNLENQ